MKPYPFSLINRIRLAFFIFATIFLTACSSEKQEEDTNDMVVQTETSEQEGSQVQEEVSSEPIEEPYVLSFTGVTTEGEILTSEIFENAKLTMINVWATFCGPCINEMPDLGILADSYDNSEFQIIGIVCDVTQEDDSLLDDALVLIEETGADYPHLLLNSELYANLVGASDSVPTTYFFNQNGELLGYLVGSQSKENWEVIINGLLADL